MEDVGVIGSEKWYAVLPDMKDKVEAMVANLRCQRRD